VKIGILGTGVVGCILAVKLSELGLETMIGTRNVSETLAKTDKYMMGDSLGEQIQNHISEANVVKAFNTINAYLMGSLRV
jgi:predicted dinucleotide-binding enzyme